MSFANSLERLRKAVSDRQHGMPEDLCIARKSDLQELLGEFDRLDQDVRTAPSFERWNFRDLLKKYMALVRDEESVTFVEVGNERFMSKPTMPLLRHEIEELQRIEKELPPR
jgi:hypothetical protein